MNRMTNAPSGAATNVFDALRTRRAVKVFDPSHRLSDTELRRLLTAAALAPTAFNIQNRHVVVVRDPATKARLQKASFGQEQVGTAAATFVLAADLDAHQRTDRYLRNAPAAARASLEPMIADSFEGNPALQAEEGARSVGMMAMSLMLAARALGYDSCPMTGFDREEVSELLGLDERHPPLMLVTVGRAAKPAHPRLGFLDLDEFVSVDRFGEAALRGPIKAD